jgi:excisionase family DNA binding protein
MSIPTDFEHYVSADIVAEYLAIEPRRVLILVRAGRLPAHAVDPTRKRRDWRFRLSEIDAAMKADATKATTATDRRYNAARQPRTQKAN